jgi:hypothetical protein
MSAPQNAILPATKTGRFAHALKLVWLPVETPLMRQPQSIDATPAVAVPAMRSYMRRA